MIEPTTGKEKEMENTTRAHLSLVLHYYWKKVDVLIHLLLFREKPACNAVARAKRRLHPAGFRQMRRHGTGLLGMLSRWCQTWAQANEQIQPRRFRVIYDFATMNLASGDSLRGPRDLKALWEAHVIYCILVLRENDVSTNVAPDYGPTHDA